MQPTWQTDGGRVKLWLADCLDVLDCIEADACIVDPPYGISHSSNRGASWENTQIQGDGDTAIRDAILAWADTRLPWACFGTWKIPTPDTAKGVLVWDKGPASGMGDLSFPWKGSWEEIAVGGIGWQGSRDEGVIRGHRVITWETAGRSHPHEKPVSLVEYLLSKLPAAVTILDPTMGSGTTGVAAVRCGRSFLGCENDPKHYERAKARIQAELERMPLFEEKPKYRQAELVS